MCVFVCLGINFPTFLRSRPMQKWIRCVCLCVLENFLSKHRFFYDSEKSRFSWIFEFSPKLSGSHPKASRTRRMPRGSRASILERFRCPENRQKNMEFSLFYRFSWAPPVVVWCLIALEFRTHEDILAPLSQRTIWEGLYESSRAVNNGWRFTARTKSTLQVEMTRRAFLALRVIPKQRKSS